MDNLQSDKRRRWVRVELDDETERINHALELLDEGETIDDIVNLTGLSRDFVETL